MDSDSQDNAPPRRDEAYTYTPASFGSDNSASGASEPIPAQFTPVPAPGGTPAWEWQGGAAGAAPPPPTPPANGWYTVVGNAPARPVVFDAPPRTEASQSNWRKSPVVTWLSRLWPLLLLGLTKAKWLLVIFKFKAFTTFGSLLVSLGFYAMAFGLPFAAGFIALLFIHELGHALVMRQQGIKTTPILFVPFMGAVIGMKEMPKNVYAEAKMALGGPILGSIGALGCLALWQVTGAPIFVALAMVGFWLNLFNLIPVSPLDGGRAMAAISPWGWLVGLGLLLLLFLRVHSIFLGFILIVGGMEVFNRWRSRTDDRAYYEATLQQRLIITAVYFGLAALLAFGVFALQGHVLSGQPIR
jgi:Zn-dependent protease